MLAGFLLDGASHSLLLKKGDFLPTIRDFYLHNTRSKIISETPPLSPVCWTSFLTEKDPSGHNIYGFIERDFLNDKFYVPNFNDISSKTIFTVFEKKGLKFAAVNIPGTYPPPRSNSGIIISDFLSPSLSQAVNQKWLLTMLEAIEYKIDIDPYKHKKNKDGLLKEMGEILDSRKILLRYLSNQNIDIILFHIMELDRLCHFFYRDLLNENSPYFLSILNILYKIDELFKDFLNYFEKRSGSLFLLSDHGFQGIKYEFLPNALFHKLGLLKLDTSKASTETNDLPILSPSLYFSLYPGRTYCLTKDLKKKQANEQTEKDLKDIFLNIKHEGIKLIRDIIPSADLYSNKENIPFDYYLLPERGIDIKGLFSPDTHIRESFFQGMHDPEDGIFATLKPLTMPDCIRITHIAGPCLTQAHLF